MEPDRKNFYGLPINCEFGVLVAVEVDDILCIVIAVRIACTPGACDSDKETRTIFLLFVVIIFPNTTLGR